MLPRPTSLTAGFAKTTEAYSQGKFLTNAAQHRSYPNGRDGIRTHDPVVGYLVWLRATFLAAQVRTVPDGSDRPTAVVSRSNFSAGYLCWLIHISHLILDKFFSELFPGFI